MSDPERLLTFREVAEELRMSTKTLRAHIASEAIDYVNIGTGARRRRIVFRRKDVDAFLRRQTNERMALTEGGKKRRGRPRAGLSA